VIDSKNDAGEEFGEERLIEVLRRHRDLSSQDLLGATVDKLLPVQSS
jgi:serine phosphatase RsbU (regulator of sigma subunit)